MNRYSMGLKEIDEGLWVEPILKENGAWVKYEEVKAIEARNAELVEALETLVRATEARCVTMKIVSDARAALKESAT